MHQNMSKRVKMRQNASKRIKTRQNASKRVKTRQNVSKCIKFTKIVNFGGRDPRFWVSVYLSLKRCQYKSNFQNLSISILEIQDLGYLSICQSYKHI